MTSTYDYLAFHATERPGAVALITDGRTVTYSQFRRDVATLSRALRAFGLARGSLVTVGYGDLYGHWLLLLAFERLGVVTASLSDNESVDCLPLLASSDLVFAESGFPTQGARRHHSLSPEWLSRALQGEEDAEPPAEWCDDNPVRVGRTSGTTGEAKRLLFTRQIHDRRTDNWGWCVGLTWRARYLLTMALKIAGGYIHATAGIRVGATVVWESRRNVIQSIGDYGITHVTLLPAWLRQVLHQLPDAFEKPRELTVASFGAALPPALRAEALARLATEVVEFYGSNEMGFVSSISSESTPQYGTVWPGVRVEIVDAHDRVLPERAIGNIRARTDAMVDRYVDEPEETARMFRNGWFYPGDTGRKTGENLLEIIARDDDLLNIGGNKFSPLKLEEHILRSTGAADVGVFTLPEPSGVEELCVAVSGWRDSDEELTQSITRALGTRGLLGRFHIVKVAGIPRTQTGKIQRHLLKRAAGGVAK